MKCRLPILLFLLALILSIILLSGTRSTTIVPVKQVTPTSPRTSPVPQSVPLTTPLTTSQTVLPPSDRQAEPFTEESLGEDNEDSSEIEWIDQAAARDEDGEEIIGNHEAPLLKPVFPSGPGESVPVPRHAYLPPNRLRAPFPHWRLLTDRSMGVTRQIVLNDPTVCADLFVHAIFEELVSLLPSSSLNTSSSNTNVDESLTNSDYFLLSPRRRAEWRAARYSCEWYHVETIPMASRVARQSVGVFHKPRPSQIILKGTFESHLRKGMDTSQTAVIAAASKTGKVDKDNFKYLFTGVIRSFHRQMTGKLASQGLSDLGGVKLSRAVKLLLSELNAKSFSTLTTNKAAFLRALLSRIHAHSYGANLATAISTPYLLLESNRVEWIGGASHHQRLVALLKAVKASDILLEAQRFGEGLRNKSLPWGVPNPRQLSTLSPTSPMLLHLLGNEVLTYHSDRLLRVPSIWPRSLVSIGPTSLNISLAAPTLREVNAQVSSNFLNVWTTSEASALFSGFGSAPATGPPTSFLLPVDLQGLPVVESLTNERSNRNMYGRYVSLAAAIDNNSSQQGPFQANIPIAHRVHTLGQLVGVLNERLVRLSPSASPFFEEPLLAAMLQGQTDDGPIEGMLSQAPTEVKASAIDASAGHWNMSDMPRWLRIPSRVNVANCLDPLNQAPGRNDANQDQDQRLRHDDDVFSPKRSILIIGASHGRNLYTSICSQYLHSREHHGRFVNGHKGYASKLAALDGLCQFDKKRQNLVLVSREQLYDTLPSDDPFSRWMQGKGLNESQPPEASPYALAFCWSPVEYLRDIEACAGQILSQLREVKARREIRLGRNPSVHSSKPSASLALADKTSAELNEHYPAFIRRAADSNQTNFNYSNFFLHTETGTFEELKGLFTHVVYAPGMWEVGGHDATIAEHTENVAITLDLIDEVFAPQKTILYNIHSLQEGVLLDPTGDALRASELEVPTFGGFERTEWDEEGASTKSLHQPKYDPSYTHSPGRCYNMHRVAKIRDAQICATSHNTRNRVRRAWRNELLRYLKADTASHVDTFSRRSPTEIVDLRPQTAQSLAYLFVDTSGHHYTDIVLEAMAQRVLRDHVCPPSHVGIGNSMADWDVAEKKVNFANSLLPDEAPKTGNSSRIRVRHNSASTMPRIETSDRGELEITSLFPTLKMPVPRVMEGLCRAIFDNQRSADERSERAVPTETAKAPRSGNISSYVGSINQYDPYATTPHCSCLKSLRLVRNGSHPLLSADGGVSVLEEVRRAAAKSIADSLKNNNSLADRLLWHGAVPPTSSPSSDELITFAVFQSRSFQADARYLLRVLNDSPACSLADPDLSEPNVCDHDRKKHPCLVSVIEELRRRMVTYAHVYNTKTV